MKPQKPLGILTTLAALVAILPMASEGVNISFNGTANALNLPAAWVGGVVPGSGDIATWDFNSTGNLSEPLGASTNWAGIAVISPVGAVTIPSGNILTLGASGIDMSAATTNLTISCTLSNGASQNWNVAAGVTLTMANTLMMPAANLINVNGAGTLVLNSITPDASADPFTGSGTITLKGGSSPTFKGGQWNTSGRLNIQISSGQKAAFNGNVTVGSVLASNGVTLYPSSSGTFIVAGNGSQLGGVGNGEGRGVIRAEEATVLNGTVLLLNDNSGAGVPFGGSSPLIFNGVIDDGNPGGAGYGISKSVTEGQVNIQLGAANTYHGITRWNYSGSGNTLTLTNQFALQNSTLTITAGTLAFGSSLVTNAFTLGGLSGSANIALQNTASAAIALSIGNNNNSTNYTGVLSGPGSIVKVGTGAQTNSGANSYAGSTTINAGKLVISSDGAAGANAQLGLVPSSATPGSLVISGGTLSTAGNAASFALNANRGLALGPTNATGSGTIEVAGGATIVSYAGIAANNTGGTGGLIKTGSGTLSLGASSTYSGDTVVSRGTLAVGSGVTFASSSLTIGAGATVDLSAQTSPYSFGFPIMTNSGTASAATLVGPSGGTVTVATAVPVTLNYDGSDPSLTVSQGTLALNGNAITVNTAAPLGIGAYTLIQASGTGSVTTNGSETLAGTALGAPNTTASLAVVNGNLQLNIQSTFVFSAFTITGGSSLTAGGSEVITITAVDSGGNPVTAVNGAFSLTFRGLGVSPIGASPTVNGVAEGHPTPVTFVSGTTTATLMVTKAEGPVTLNGTEGFHDTTSPGGAGMPLTVSVGSAGYLALPTRPSSTSTAGTLLASQPVVTIVDPYGNVVNSGVNVMVGANTGTVQGATTVTASSGTATFSGLGLNTEGTIVLTFTSTGLGSTNATVVVSPNVPAALGILTQPTTVYAGVVFTNQPAIGVEDAYGNVISNSTLSITATNATGTGTLTGATTTNATAGVAQYSGLMLTNVGTTTLLFTNSTIPAYVNMTVNASGGYVTGITWSGQPGSAEAGRPFGTQPVLRTVDQFGNFATLGLEAYQYVNVTLTGVGNLGGSTNVNIGTAGGNGVFNFTNLKVSAGGTGNTLTASAPGIIATNPATITGLANCRLWLDAGDVGSMTFSGSTVTGWADKSGTGNNGTGGTSPTFNTNALLAANGSGFGQVMRFSGGGGFSVSFVTLSNSPYSLLVMDVGGSTGSTHYFFQNTADGQNDHALGFGYQDSGQFRWQQYGDDLNYPGSDTAGTYTAAIPRQWSGVMTAARAQSFYSNSISVSTRTANGLLGGPNLGLGNVGGSGFSGDIAEILIYNTALSTAQLTALESYLTNKWLYPATPATAVTASFSVATNYPPVANPVTNDVIAGVSWKIAISSLQTQAAWSDPDSDPVTFNGVSAHSANGTNVTSDSTYIYYNGTVAATSTDSITYTITDGGFITPAMVYLVPVTATASSIANPTVNGSGNPTFNGNGIPGYTYGVESAPTPTGPWSEAGTVTAGSNGSWSFTDPSQTNPSTIFYRLYYPDNPLNPPQ